MGILDRFSSPDPVTVLPGAGRVIGAATAIALAEAGADVLISARHVNQLEAVASKVREAGRRALVVPADLSATDAAAGPAQAAPDEFGRLEILLNHVRGTITNAFLHTDVAYLVVSFHFHVTPWHALPIEAVPALTKGVVGPKV